MPITFTAFVQHISEMATLVLHHTMPYSIAKLPLALCLNQIVTSTMNKFFVCILLCMFIVTIRTPTASADQNDPRLDQLFAVLLTPLSTTAVQKIESQIWEYWLSFPNDQTIENTMAAAILMMERGQLKSAENIFGRIIEREPQFAEAWNTSAPCNH